MVPTTARDQELLLTRTSEHFKAFQGLSPVMGMIKAIRVLGVDVL